MSAHGWSDEEAENLFWLLEESWVPGRDAVLPGVERHEHAGSPSRPHDTRQIVDRFPWELVAALILIVLMAMAGQAIGGFVR